MKETPEEALRRRRQAALKRNALHDLYMEYVLRRIERHGAALDQETEREGGADAVLEVGSPWHVIALEWGALPVEAAGQTVQWPEFELRLDDRTFLLVDGRTDRMSGQTSFRVRLGSGRRSPAAEIQINVVLQNGSEIAPIEKGPFHVGDVVTFAGIMKPRDVKTIRFQQIS